MSMTHDPSPRRLFGALALLTVGLVACLGLTTGGALADEEIPPAQPGDQPILLELFTSQGCSSCPPADRVLRRLGVGELRERIVPLSFHVDYWNDIGWDDPFSSADWSNRQRLYARSMGSNRIYTPQLVVHGQEHLVGSRERDARARIRAALQKRPAADVTLTLTRGAAALKAQLTARPRRAIDSERLALLVVTFESGLVTEVKRGENSGETLKNDYVVRRLDSAGSVKGSPGAATTQTLTLPIKPTWDAKRLGVAAFVQDTRTMEVFGVAVERPPK